MPKSFFRRFTKHIVINSNILVAMLFLLGCYGYFFNPQKFWPIGFLTLANFYFLAILILFLVFWLLVKPKRSLLSFTAILVSLPALKNVIPLRFSTTFHKIKPDSTIRVMSWNIEHFDILEHKTKPEVKQQMFDLINDYAPDIACFQEMVGSDSFPNAINYIPSIQQQLSFSNHYYSYNKKVDFDGNHHFGIILFSKFPLVNKQTVSFPPHDYNSIFQYVDLVTPTDTIRVFNIHLQSLKFSPSNLKYIENPDFKDDTALRKTKSLIYKLRIGFQKRQIQADRIREEIAKSPYPVILCGDFNDVPNSYAYHTIGSGLQNAFEEKGNGVGRTFSGISPVLRIDNIFAGNAFQIKQFATIRKKMSDHFPIVADMDLPKK
jgi:endonuclease/exonuclease/phosphatase family metal-dependent hydrolase